jgi:hypothetical protein
MRSMLCFAIAVATSSLLGGSALASTRDSVHSHGVHRAARVDHLAHSAHLRHARVGRHEHGIPAATLERRTVRGAAADHVPAPPHRHGNQHRAATVPHAVHNGGAPRSLRSGGHAPLAFSSATRPAEQVRMLGRDRTVAAPISVEHFIVSGRGPPRASPPRPSSLSAPPSFPSAHAASQSSPHSSRAVPGPALSRAAPSDEPSLFTIDFDRGGPMGRLHVRCLEGTAARFKSPSS